MLIDPKQASRWNASVGAGPRVVLRGNESQVLGDLGVDLIDLSIILEIALAYERIRDAVNRHIDPNGGLDNRLRAFPHLLQFGPNPEPAVAIAGVQHG